MAEVAFRADLKLAAKTMAAIDQALLAGADDGLRPHLGASQIGHPCERALWYGFRWARKATHDARTLRLFARGQREESVIADLLRAAGIEFVAEDPSTGSQYRLGGTHFSGSMDGACFGLPEAPKSWHVVEIKTHSAKSFNDLAAKGVRESKPQHWAQMQCYMHWTGMERALYVAACKDDDRLHLERVEYDKAEAEHLEAKANRIIFAASPPARLSEDPAYYQCKFCDHAQMCHGTDLPLPTCRSCAHATPEQDGWFCDFHQSVLGTDAQRNGCKYHVFIPHLLANFADVFDTRRDQVTYLMRDNSGEFTNGPLAFSSDELHACTHKQMLVDPQVLALRGQFDARVTA